PEAQAAERESGGGGAGEEFVASAMNRDIRNIEDISDADLTHVHEWCALAPHREAQESCIMAARTNLFWGGENDPRAAIALCRLTEDPVIRDACYRKLTNDALYFLGKTPAIFRVCVNLPEPHRSFCLVNGT
ncbi:MAG: hypothetical protein AAB923_00825, partial [Patescibacteria group bacterium]